MCFPGPPSLSAPTQPHRQDPPCPLGRLAPCTVRSACDGLLPDRGGCSNEIVTLGFFDANRALRLDETHAKTLTQKFGDGAGCGCWKDSTDPELLQLGVLDDQLFGILPI